MKRVRFTDHEREAQLHEPKRLKEETGQSSASFASDTPAAHPAASSYIEMKVEFPAGAMLESRVELEEGEIEEEDGTSEVDDEAGTPDSESDDGLDTPERELSPEPVSAGFVDASSQQLDLNYDLQGSIKTDEVTYAPAIIPSPQSPFGAQAVESSGQDARLAMSHLLIRESDGRQDQLQLLAARVQELEEELRSERQVMRKERQSIRDWMEAMKLERQAIKDVTVSLFRDLEALRKTEESLVENQRAMDSDNKAAKEEHRALKKQVEMLLSTRSALEPHRTADEAGVAQKALHSSDHAVTMLGIASGGKVQGSQSSTSNLVGSYVSNDCTGPGPSSGFSPANAAMSTPTTSTGNLSEQSSSSSFIVPSHRLMCEQLRYEVLARFVPLYASFRPIEGHESPSFAYFESQHVYEWHELHVDVYRAFPHIRKPCNNFPSVRAMLEAMLTTLDQNYRESTDQRNLAALAHFGTLTPKHFPGILDQLSNILKIPAAARALVSPQPTTL